MYMKIRKINNKKYYSLVKSYRIKNKIKQKTILSLGDKEKAYKILRDLPEYSHFLNKIEKRKTQLYKTIYADPPWLERGSGKYKRGADKHYPLMKTKDIISIKISEIADTNAHLYLWSTNNFLEDAFKVIKSWGFRYITKITWIKGKKIDNNFVLNNPGLGQYFRGLDEICLFAVKGSLPKKIPSTTVLISPRRKHSQKPSEMYKIIEDVSYQPYIELFARKRANKKWDTWGNEIYNDIKL